MLSEKQYFPRAAMRRLSVGIICLRLTTLLILAFMLLSFGGTHLHIKFIFIVFSAATRELGIDFRLGIALFVIAVFCFRIHIPLYLTMSAKGIRLRSYELFPVWLLKQRNASYRNSFQVQHCVAINLVGGIIPIGIALYQFGRNSPSSILMVTSVVTVMSYVFASVIPGKGICFRRHQLWILVIVAALSALKMAEYSSGSAAAIAFSGSVLGTLIGVDLLHLREAQAKAVGGMLSIGGARLKDGIVRCGMIALLLAGWISHGVNLLR